MLLSKQICLFFDAGHFGVVSDPAVISFSLDAGCTTFEPSETFDSRFSSAQAGAGF